MDDLKEIGLTKNESKVYLALIDLGPSLAGKISRYAGIHRRTVYDTAEMLIKKGLIGYIINNNRRTYQASNPTKLLQIIREKEIAIVPIIKTLESRYLATKEKEETNFYKGTEGLKTIFEDQLNYSEILILGASTKAHEILRFYFKWYDKKRKHKKIKAKIIAQDKRIKKIPLTKIRYLPEKYVNPVSINIYGDKTAIILWAKKPLAILIKNNEITDGYRQYFSMLWDIAKS